VHVLVTGSTGFLGGALCQALVAQSHQVRAFHRASSNLALIRDLPVEHAIGHLSNPESLQKAMEGIDVVFHIAAMLGSEQNPSKMYAVNVEGTRHVLEAAHANGVKRFIHTSSVAALGVPLDAEPNLAPTESLWINENHTWNFPSSYWPYGYSKYLAELEVQMAVSRGLDVVIVNPTYVVGAGDVYRKSSSVIVKIAQNKLPFGTTGGLNVIHIDDVVNGHLAAMQYGRTGERYILGGTNVSVPDFLETIAKTVNVSAPRLIVPGAVIRRFAAPLNWINPIINLPVSPEITRLAGYGFYYSIEKSRRELNLQPARSLIQAISDAYEWFQASRLA